jgi:HEAT repeat protein
MHRVLISLILCACTKKLDPGSAPYWVARLGDEEHKVEAIHKLAELGDTVAVPALLEQLLGDGDARADAASALGMLGDAWVAAKLVTYFEYNAGSGRDRRTAGKNRMNQNIMKALVLLRSPEGVDPALRFLESSHPESRLEAIQTLGKLGSSKATAALIEVADTEPNAFIRKNAIQALGEIGDKAATAVLIKALFQELPGVSFYYEARHALLQVGSPAVPLLVETLLGQNKDVAAIRQPSGVGVAPGAPEAKASFVLGSLRAREAEPAIVAAAEKYYRQFQNREREAVYASVPGAVMEMCYALGKLGGGADFLRRVVLDEDPNMRVAAAEALVDAGDKGAAATLLRAARSGTPQAKTHAVVALSRLGHDVAAYDALAKDDPIATVVQANRPRIQAAAECQGDSACWVKQSKDPSPLVRERAALELGWLDAKAHRADLLPMLEDDSATVRVAAAASLRRGAQGLDTGALQAVYDRASEKMTYKDANADLQRLIALARAYERPAQGAATAER